MKKHLRYLVAAVATAAMVIAPAAAASALSIEPAGPLVRIDISETLNCAINHAGDDAGEFYGDTACGTFVAVGDELYGPEHVPAGSMSRSTWTVGSQTSGGVGTEADPYRIVTTVTGGDLGVTQTDSYVEGAHHYTTESVVTNTSDADVDITLYHAADCYLGDDDSGFGAYDAATGAVSCVAPDAEGAASDASRIEQFIPQTPGSNFLYSGFSDVWNAVESKLPFPNELRNADNIMDNGMGLSWTVTVPAGGSVPFVLQTNFSPVDVDALSTTLTVDPASVFVGNEATVTARVVNPNETDQELSSATVVLPAGVEYVADSAEGVAEPMVSDGQLAFSGEGAAISGGSVFEFTFKVTTSAVGEHDLTLAAAVESRVDVAPSSARLTVGLPELPTVLSLDPESVTVSEQSNLVGGIINEHAVDFTLSEIVVDLPAGANYVAGSVEGIDEPTVVDGSLVFAGPILVEANSMFPFLVQIETSEVGSLEFVIRGSAEGATVLESRVSLLVEAAVSPTVEDSEQPAAPKPAEKKPAGLANTGAENTLLGLSAVAGVLVLGSAVALGAAAIRRKAGQ